MVRRVEFETVNLPNDGVLNCVVVADTHSKPNVRGMDLIAAEAPAVIIHGGDIGDLSVLDALREIAPVIAVAGNIDSSTHYLPDAVVIRLMAGGQAASTWFLTHIAVRGPKLRGPVANAAFEYGAQIVICGHSHVPFIGRDRGLAVFNPGSIGPRRFSLPITYGRLQVAPDGITFKHINCETGKELELIDRVFAEEEA